MVKVEIPTNVMDFPIGCTQKSFLMVISTIRKNVLGGNSNECYGFSNRIYSKDILDENTNKCCGFPNVIFLDFPKEKRKNWFILGNNFPSRISQAQG